MDDEKINSGFAIGMDDNSSFMSKSNFADPNAEIAKTVKETDIKPEDINAVLALADDGRTIILCDYKFKSPPSVIILNLNTSLLTISGGTFGTPGVELQYPVESAKIDIWKNEPVTYFAYVDDMGGRELYEVPVYMVAV